jgi:hypothetical protein
MLINTLFLLHLSIFLQGIVEAINQYMVAHTVFYKLLRVKNSCSKAEELNTLETGELSFLADGSVKIVMPLLQQGSSRARDIKDSSHCFQLVGNLDVKFLFSLTAGTAKESKFVFMLRKEHIQKIAFLLELLEFRKESSSDASKETQCREAVSIKRKFKKRRVSEADTVFTVPFEPPQPASASGLVLLLLLLEEAAPPFQLFYSSSGPRLAVQCLSVRPISCCDSAVLFATFVPCFLCQLIRFCSFADEFLRVWCRNGSYPCLLLLHPKKVCCPVPKGDIRSLLRV